MRRTAGNRHRKGESQQGGRRSSAAGLRLVGGTFGGLRINAAGDSRPTQSQVREALFSRWQFRVAGARVIDLFCGGGAVGLEALSRGASSVCLVDADSMHLDVARANAALLEVEVRTACLELPSEWRAGPVGWPSKFDLVFADPPYNFDDFAGLLRLVGKLVDEDGEVAIEHSRRIRLPGIDQMDGSLEPTKEKVYGETQLSYFRHKEQPRTTD